jgi:molecular chaperone DnaK
LLHEFWNEAGIDLRQDPRAMARLREAAEIAKIDLSTRATTRVIVPYIGVARGEAMHLDRELARADLDRLVWPIVERCRGPVMQALHDASVAASDIDHLILVGGPTLMPIVRRTFEELFGRRPESGIDPMESVARGAAIQSGVLGGQLDQIVLVDVTPLTLGVETLGGVATPLIARNTPIPVHHSEIFTTAADGQTTVTVHVFQGERPVAAENTSLGELHLEGLTPAPRGIPKIEVSFDIDTSGILDVSARDLATGAHRSVRITGSARLSANERERMAAEAEQSASADQTRRESAEKLAIANAVCRQAERALTELGDVIPSELGSQVEAALRGTRKAMEIGDLELVGAEVAALQQALQQVGPAIYAQLARRGLHPQSAVAAPTGRPRPTGAGPRGSVVDTELRDSA